MKITDYRGDNRAHVKVPRIDWRVLRDVTDGALGDALHILDCCGAASAAMRTNGNEYMCASAVDSIASSNLDQSFTRHFIDLLKRYQSTPMSVTAWNMLKEDGTIAFCGIVKSDNLMLAFTEAQERGLAERIRPRVTKTSPLEQVQAVGRRM
jgi:hypothetical protein